MRIQRSRLVAVQRLSRTLFQKTPLVVLSALVIVGGVVVGQNLITAPQAAYASTPPDNCFAFTASTGTITGYYDNQGNDSASPACPKMIDIPATIGGSAVRVMDDWSFYNKGLTSVTIPSGVTNIGSHTFYFNQLTSVTVPNSVTSIGDSAFQYNSIATISILGTPTTIGIDVIANNPITSVVHTSTTYSTDSPTQQSVSPQCFENSAGTITKYYYMDLKLIVGSGIVCASNTVDIPQILNGVTTTAIGDSAFYNAGLSSVTIPSSVTSIGYGAFQSNQLTSLTIPNSVTSIGDWAFSMNLIPSVTIPNSVTSIGHAVFYNNQLTSVIVPSSVTSIGDWAFSVNQLTSVTIPNSVTSIGDYAFYGNQLTSIAIPTNMTSIGADAFYGNQITSVTIPSGVTSIGDSAFQSNQITTVNLLGTPTTIGTDVIANNPIVSVTYNGITYSMNSGTQQSASPQCFAHDGATITKYLFMELRTIVDNGVICNAKTIDLPQNIDGVTITSVGDSAFYGNQLTSVTIPSSVTSIGTSAFQSNSLTSITIPGSVTSIGDYAFYSNQLTSVTIPSGVTSIGNYAFYGNQLTSVTIPGSVTTLGDNAFQSNHLASIILLATPSTIGKDVITDNPIMSVTHGSTTYSVDIPVSPIPSQCFEHDIGTLTSYRHMDLGLIINSGTICNAKSIDVPQSLDGVTITSIGDSAFYGAGLTSVTIPSSVRSIGASAFRSNRITSLTIPNSVTSIDYGAFYLNDIPSLVIPDSVAFVGRYAFEANQLSSLTIGCGVTGVGQEAFAINKLTDVTIPNCITSIDPTAFFGQNPWGGIVEQSYDPAHDWWSPTASVKRLVWDNLWYTRLHTSDPTNPHHLTDGIINESWYTGDISGDGEQTSSLGGHLINPASITANYVDGSGTHLTTDYSSTGHLNNGTNLADYLVKNVPTPNILDPQSPTVEEQTTLELALGAYYRQGQNLILSAPAIAGYGLQHPGPVYTTNLSGKNNTVNFTYAALSPASQPPVSPPVSTSTDKTTDQITPATQPVKNEAIKDKGSSLVLDTPRTTVDFTAQAGSAANPTSGAVPSGLATIMTKSSFAIDEATSCHQINSAKLLSANNFTSTDTGQATLGGLAFVLNCQSSGGNAKVTFALGGAISDLTGVRVYKVNTQGVSTDITDKVSLNNRSSDGRTTISYILVDGQSFDDDGQANSSISDPIYITAPRTALLTPPTKTVASVPTKPRSWLAVAVITGVIATGAIVATVVIIVRRQRRS